MRSALAAPARHGRNVAAHRFVIEYDQRRPELPEPGALGQERGSRHTDSALREGLVEAVSSAPSPSSHRVHGQTRAQDGSMPESGMITFRRQGGDGPPAHAEAPSGDDPDSYGRLLQGPEPPGAVRPTQLGRLPG